MGEYGDVAAHRDFEESFQIEQEKNSSWMRTAHLETVRVSVSVASTRRCSGGASPPMNKFEQVSIDQN